MIEFTQVWGCEEGPTWFTSCEKAQSEGLPEVIVSEAIMPGTMNITGQTEVMSAAD